MNAKKAFGSSVAFLLAAACVSPVAADALPAQEETYDVIVAGGGPAGIGAGYMAAKRGAKTLVLEKSGRLGGMAVSAMVSPFSIATKSPIVNDLVERMGCRGSVDFHLADVKAYDVLAEAGAEVLLHSNVLGPVMEGERVVGLRVNCEEGERVFRAKVVIDATGNGVVAAAAGVPYEEGRDGDGLVQPMSVMFTVGGFDPSKRFICGSEEAARSKRCVVRGKTWEAIVQDEIKAGNLPPEVGVIRLYPGAAKDLNVVNATQVNGLYGSRSADRTKAEIAARKQAAQIVDVMRRHLPGYENAAIAEMPAVVGVRETRRFEGVDRLTTEDVLSGRKRADAVARNCSFVIDIHNPAGAGQSHGHDKAVTGGARRVKPYDIPYGALVPKKVEGLLFCGRCISASHEALASCRVMGNAMATGIGAGAAAAEAVKKGIEVRAVDASALGLFGDGEASLERDFRIRDPFVLVEGGKYWLYESKPWSGGNGVAFRTSADLVSWTPKKPAMVLPGDVEPTAVWAPEVHKFGDRFYMFVTITEKQGTRPMAPMGEGVNAKNLAPRGTWVFVADKPEGPFVPVKKGPVPPTEFQTLDGTLYVEDGKPYMVYCHEWCQMGNGTIEYAPLSPDFASFEASPVRLLDARSAMEGAASVTDGPFFHRSAKSGRLYMIWSNMVKGHGYCVFVRSSESGKIAGPWTKDELLFDSNGGHAMIFTDLKGRLRMTLHRPNKSPDERMKLFGLEDDGEHLRIVER